ncbi:ATP-binding cassette domain-containing protein [Plastoroseomonas arctica]|uniref:ATP-binding cassette domain-containing protein n=1 Tax=Plastoroseomonas arctica TaxID=1509237 RepID=A0AAF1K6S5_9PROT|nr:ATP-binding cassette domain-containing protein [Plastoroseomonas arctica]MBR0656781.1 ATP-binding cassette domain-containing protein [Plastoroseomonas arctica]
MSAHGRTIGDHAGTAGVMALCLGLSVGVQCALLASPLLTMHVFDGVLQSRNDDTLLALTVGFVLMVSLGGLLRYLRARLVATATESAGMRLQSGALGASVRGAMAGDRARGLAALGDVSEVRRMLGGAVASDLLDLLTVPAAIAFLFLLHPIYGWTAVGGCVLLALLGALADRTTRALVRSAMSEQARSTAALTGRLRGRDMLHGLGMLRATLQRWRPEGQRAIELGDAAQRRARAIQGLASFTGLMLQMVMVTIGAWLVARQEASTGSLLAATMLAGMAAAPVSRVVATWRDWAFGVAAWRRLTGFIATNAPPPWLPHDAEAPAGLHVANLTVTTPDGTRTLVRALDLAVAPGSVLGVRGPNGAGKSTLLRALLGICAVRDGERRLDGHDLRMPGLRNAAVGYLPQGAQLLHGSVLDNIRRFGDGDAASAVAAARRVGAHDAIGRLPRGYDTPAGSQSGLSGGQRQLVALARAFHGAPRLLVLDEPEAGLDAASIALLHAAVANARDAGAVIILVTHDPAEWAGLATEWLDLAADGAWHLTPAAKAGDRP